MVEPHARCFRGERVTLPRVSRSHDPVARPVEQIVSIACPVGRSSIAV
jgi:hypothetical protein